jgi:hypothetical protein
MHQEKLCYKILRLLVASLRISLGWIWRHSQAALIWGGVLVTLAGAFFLLPRVTIEPSGPYDPSNPTPLIFTIANTNIVPLRNVQAGIGLCYIAIKDDVTLKGKGAGDIGPDACNGPSIVKLNITAWFVKWLDVDEKFQIAIEEGIKVDARKQIDNANFTIAVVYTPWLMPSFWRNTKEFRFVTKKLSDGKIYWTPIPLNR